ncbi:hypothetical protein GCM10010909_22450 [Acidocella aquatica]|uniref:Uncharacterized protein n=1 Tax=Acidocella aquatica TaxID=1922313 RepID=A0ABQ6A5X1_9PROT|nr:hypothetical protein [Acidocella aquatica]GLR67564.1 hypothetical protein GCM10010909_22450 [Acidocella aquatica]
MSHVILTLGGVAFRDMEVPEKISFGGRQNVVVRQLIGGGRVVEVLGLDDGKISFSGIFSGGDAVSRAQMLDAARALGASLPLVWDGFFYTVIIEEFCAEYYKTNLIPFAVTCVVVSDPLASLAAIAAPVGNLISNDLAAAGALSGQAGMSLAGISAASLTGVLAIKDELAGIVGTQGVALSMANSALSGAADAQGGVLAVSQINTISSRLAAAAAVTGYVGRAAINLESELL